VGAGLPAPFRKPSDKGCWQGDEAVGIDLIHAPEVMEIERKRSALTAIRIVDIFYPRIEEAVR
jgi:hypothetical protein